MIELEQNNLSTSQLFRAAPELVLHPLHLAEPLKFCQKLKQIMSLTISKEHNNQGMVMQLIQQCTKRKDKIGNYLAQYLKIYLVGNGGGSSWKSVNDEKGSEVLAYLAKIMENRYQTDKQTSVAFLWKTVLQGQKIIKGFREQIDSGRQFEQFEIIKIILFNSAVGYSQLNMYEQALKNINILQGYSDTQTYEFRRNVENLKGVILAKMGRKSQLLKHISSTTTINASNSSKDFDSADNCSTFINLVSKSKQEFINFINQLSKESFTVSLGNAYNLSLLCKKFDLHTQGIQILQKILLTNNISQIIKWKSLTLMSKFYDFLGNYSEAIDCLSKIDCQDNETRKQIQMRTWELNKKNKIKEASSTCPALTPIATHRYKLLEGLQFQLLKLSQTGRTDSTLFTSRKMMTSTASTLYSVCSKKKLSSQVSEKRLLSQTNELSSKTISNQSSGKKLTRQLSEKKLSTQISEKKLSRQLHKKSAKSFISQSTSKKLSIPSHKSSDIRTSRTMKKSRQITIKIKKAVRFQVATTHVIDDQLPDIIYRCQEAIQGQLLMENRKAAINEINNSLDKIWARDRPIETRNGYKFMLKCVNWFHQLNDVNSAITLLTKMVTMNPDKQQKIELLNQLSNIYQHLNDEKKIIAVNQQLFKLGQLESLVKIAELYLVRQKYSEAIKYYEQFYNQKPTIYAQVKLAHAYSKVCTFMKKAINMLNHILFQNKTNCIYRKFPHEETDIIQSAVLLLASIYMQSKGFKKAEQICQKYIESNYSSYPIYHLLGVISLEINDPKNAFQYFINALKLKPNHLPSLIEAVRYVHSNRANKSQVIQIVRKAFAYNHRNWEMLLLLTQVLGGQMRNQRGVTLRGLIDCALIVEDAGGVQQDLLFEAEAIWLWALEFLQQQENKLPVGQKDQLTILIRLGEINMLKGNFSRSEAYFTRIISKLNQKTNQLSKPRCDEIKLHLKILDKLTFLKLQQDKVSQAFQLLDEAYQLAKRHFLLDMLAEIKKKRQILSQCHGL